MTLEKNVQSLPDSVLKNFDSIIYHYSGQPVSRKQLFNHAVHVSRQLPERGYAVNLCQNRYLFAVSFLAVCLKQQINLLPPNLSSGSIASILAQYTDSYCLIDQPGKFPSEHFIIPNELPRVRYDSIPSLNTDAIASISFTSGSTGEPKAIAKTWREFQKSALLANQQLQLNEQPLVIVSTVPPQHMYGLETSLFWPLYSKLEISGSRPFYPEDIRSQIGLHNKPCLLISSPIHIKVCLESNFNWNNIAKVLSSTAPIATDLVVKAEQTFKAPLYEIFGSTETLSFASRRPIKNNLWQPYRGISLKKGSNGFTISGGHLTYSVMLDDEFKLFPDGHFKIIGRSSDMLKIAGKRASLSELNRVINNIKGVQDAVFYRSSGERIGAFVVSELPKQEIIKALKQSLDEVFLPRPLTKVKQLPRNEIGKLMKSDMLQLIEQYDVA